MNKTQMLATLREMRDAVRQAEAAVAAGDWETLEGCLNDVEGFTSEVREAL